MSKLSFESGFLMDVILKTVVDDINPAIFSNIFTTLEVSQASLGERISVFKVMLKQPKFKQDAETWLKFIYFLGSSGQQKQAKEEYQRALLFMDSADKKTRVNEAYSKFSF
jgi:hypothetical protein